MRGDCNINIIKKKDPSENLPESLYNRPDAQIIAECHRQTENSESTINLFFTNIEGEFLVEPTSITDHNTLFLKSVVFEEENQKSVTRFGRT